MHKPVVIGRPVASRILLVGQAPGDREPKLGRPFAWTAGRTLFKWFTEALGWTEDETRERIYFAAVCRCFPGKVLAPCPPADLSAKGLAMAEAQRAKSGRARPAPRILGDRVPAPDEIANCSHWLEREFALLKPSLVLPVGKLAIRQFIPDAPLAEIIGRSLDLTYKGHAATFIPLPHPSGASPWHRMEPGKTLLHHALKRIAAHPAVRGTL